MEMHCWKCNKNMKRIKDTFQGFEVEAWKCPNCKEVIYDQEVIQPILQYNKLRKEKLTVKVGTLGKSKMLRIPKVIEKIYDIRRGERLTLGLEPKRIIIEMK